MLPGGLSALANAFRKPADLPWALHLRGVAGSCGRQLGQIFLTLAFLPYDAFISLDAVGRTLLRLLVPHIARDAAVRKGLLDLLKRNVKGDLAASAGALLGRSAAWDRTLLDELLKIYESETDDRVRTALIAAFVVATAGFAGGVFIADDIF